MSCIIFEITINFSWLGFRYVPGTFCIHNVVLYSPKIHALNNKVLKFQLHQSVSQSFRQSVISVSQLFSQSVSLAKIIQVTSLDTILHSVQFLLVLCVLDLFQVIVHFFYFYGHYHFFMLWLFSKLKLQSTLSLKIGKKINRKNK